MPSMPEAGEPAPDFEIETTQGYRSLEGFAGSYLVLYFYPRDSTPGCTTEAVDFSSLLGDFKDANTKVLGISKDSMKRHENFTAKNELKIPLGADLDGKVCDVYGAWGEKKMYGKTHMGIIRSTFLIDPNGNILKVWPKVKVKDHAKEVLSAVQEASAK